MKKAMAYPPGGAYKVGGVNGLIGGYYYGYNESPTLQTEILGMGDEVGVIGKLGGTLAPGVGVNAGIERMRGGRRSRRRRSRRSRKGSRKGSKKVKRRSIRSVNRSRKHSKKGSRKGSRKVKRRSRKSVKHSRKGSRKVSRKGSRRSRRSRKKRGGSGLSSLIPSDIVEVGRNMGHGVGGLYRGMMGEKQVISPDVMVQPIDD